MKLRSLLQPAALAATLVACLAGCATRAVDVRPLPANPAEFIAWDCNRIDDESDLVQQRATDLAWTVDERVGNNILALGVGVTVFWPALFAMRPDGLEAADLARLKGRYEALAVASRNKGCPPPAEGLSAARAAALPLALGERLVYEDRRDARGPARESTLAVSALRRGETEYRSVEAGPPPRLTHLWLQDRAGNIAQAPDGALLWPRLLRGELVLGAVTAGDMLVAGDPLARARMRGQVVAVGPQTVAGRRFDAAVIELFGDAQQGDASTRVDGAIVVDRASGVLLRLDLRSDVGSFSLQRRLVRVEPAG
ncbi:MAG: hypothetical protein Q7U73_09045 [Rubrivivax sp.]|nr:hypothetical protein [Rubrivivax sp.]